MLNAVTAKAAAPTVHRIYAEKTLRLIERAAVPNPPCFDDQQAWVDWLALSHVAKDRIAKPFDSTRGPLRPQINFCEDCGGAGQSALKKAGRCRPNWVLNSEWAAVKSPEKSV